MKKRTSYCRLCFKVIYAMRTFPRYNFDTFIYNPFRNHETFSGSKFMFAIANMKVHLSDQSCLMLNSNYRHY